ncbi:hypothetical protein CASFOL_003257 [Castilleja foliolosa]|uniref:Uncharacterized protein n=1 Tax=Castilleja foliolosa TaxID=1961234 RepID=A0ABD3EK10_9LAMI
MRLLFDLLKSALYTFQIARKGGIKSAMTRFWCLGFKFSDSGTGLALAILADIVQDLQASIC